MADDNPLFAHAGSLVITGVGMDDDTFSGEFGGRYLTYNVTKARRDCERGNHGECYVFDVDPCFKANCKVEVEPAKVARFIRTPMVLVTPLILVVEDGMVWLIDGHHRLRALKTIGADRFTAWVIEEQHRDRYLVRFNGKAEMPEPMRVPDIFGRPS